ncbi:hypothetical protein TYRP_001550 [Tyrophagus putrescentiae]|nr:hypothetical protein TYRP_001550 [Tyrophagus putrescentiae]
MWTGTLQFHTVGGEVRPRNMAVKVWETDWLRLLDNDKKVCGGDGWTPFTEKKVHQTVLRRRRTVALLGRKYCDDGTGSSRLCTLQSVAEQAAINTYLTRLEKNLSLVIPQYLWLDGSDRAPECRLLHPTAALVAAEGPGGGGGAPGNSPTLQGVNKKSKETISLMQGDIENLNKNPVPLGFIYVQLPKEKSPSEIWASAGLTWTDISASFNSTFFSRAKVPRGGGWSGDLYTVKKFKGLGEENGSISFHFSGGEVRPRNMAVKVWKRTG